MTTTIAKIIEAAPKSVKVTEAKTTTLDGFTLTHKKNGGFSILRSPKDVITVRKVGADDKPENLFRISAENKATATRTFNALVKSAIIHLKEGSEFTKPGAEKKAAEKKTTASTEQADSKSDKKSKLKKDSEILVKADKESAKEKKVAKADKAKNFRPKKGMEVSIEVDGVAMTGKITKINKRKGKIMVVTSYK